MLCLLFVDLKNMNEIIPFKAFMQLYEFLLPNLD